MSLPVLKPSCSPIREADSSLFFCFLEPDASDDNLYATRWEQILAMKPQMVQIISWNDFGERYVSSYLGSSLTKTKRIASVGTDASTRSSFSHYIGPIEGSQPGSEAWTDGMCHDGWLELTKWFVGRYKGESKEVSRRAAILQRVLNRSTDAELLSSPIWETDHGRESHLRSSTSPSSHERNRGSSRSSFKLPSSSSTPSIFNDASRSQLTLLIPFLSLPVPGQRSHLLHLPPQPPLNPNPNPHLLLTNLPPIHPFPPSPQRLLHHHHPLPSRLLHLRRFQIARPPSSSWGRRRGEGGGKSDDERARGRVGWRV